MCKFYAAALLIIFATAPQASAQRRACPTQEDASQVGRITSRSYGILRDQLTHRGLEGLPTSETLVREYYNRSVPTREDRSRREGEMRRDYREADEALSARAAHDDEVRQSSLDGGVPDGSGSEHAPAARPRRVVETESTRALSSSALRARRRYLGVLLADVNIVKHRSELFRMTSHFYRGTTSARDLDAITAHISTMKNYASSLKGRSSMRRITGALRAYERALDSLQDHINGIRARCIVGAAPAESAEASGSLAEPASE